MFLGDKGDPNKFQTVRYNFDILIDDEKMTISKLIRNLGFYTILLDSKIKEVETVYDTEKNLLSGAGLIIRKKHSAKRTYFSLVRMSTIDNIGTKEKKSFLGECEPKDQPKDFPVQIADAINKTFNNLFTINVVDIVKHCEPYLIMEITGNKYKIVSGTGYEVEMSFENMKIRNARTGRKAKVRNFSIEFELNPAYDKEREHILDVIDRYCKELAPLGRNHFEIAEVAVGTRNVVRPVVQDENQNDQNNKKSKKDKKKK